MADIDHKALYRMARESTQFTDEGGWSLTWSRETPPELKRLPRIISSQLEQRIFSGAIVKGEEGEIQMVRADPVITVPASSLERPAVTEESRPARSREK